MRSVGRLEPRRGRTTTHLDKFVNVGDVTRKRKDVAVVGAARAAGRTEPPGRAVCAADAVLGREVLARLDAGVVDLERVAEVVRVEEGCMTRNRREVSWAQGVRERARRKVSAPAHSSGDGSSDICCPVYLNHLLDIH